MDAERKDNLADRLARAVPWIEPSPFFASRVAALAFQREPWSLPWSITWVARRLVPLLTAASLVVLVLALMRDQSGTTIPGTVPLNEIVLSGTEGGVFTLEDLLLAEREPIQEDKDEPAN
jgi:hypothetical protein